MGMDVFGLEPRNQTGAYFRASVWYWHPLATFCQRLEPELTSKCIHWHSYDGDGLGDAVDSGLVDRLLRIREEALAGEPADSINRWYTLDEHTVEDFADFLESSGGFEIW